MSDWSYFRVLREDVAYGLACHRCTAAFKVGRQCFHTLPPETGTARVLCSTCYLIEQAGSG